MSEISRFWTKNPKLTAANFMRASLKDANLSYSNLQGANLNEANLKRANIEGAMLGFGPLQGTKLRAFAADLKNANLNEANLNRANLLEANLREAWLWDANLQESILSRCNLQKAKLKNADLREAKLIEANLQSAELHGARLQGAELLESDCQGVWFNWAKLQGAKFKLARVDGLTTITKCEFDKETDFTGIALDTASIDPDLKMAFRNNIRRIHWQNWLKENPYWKKLIINPSVRFFWNITDYGASTFRIILWFSGFAIVFGLLYHFLENAGLSVVHDLAIKEKPGLQLLRAVYFSVVTMTTLGFGDMYAQKSSYLGHALLMCQVILGYVILGALVTRLGILFTSEAPAAKPTPIKYPVRNYTVLGDIVGFETAMVED